MINVLLFHCSLSEVNCQFQEEEYGGSVHVCGGGHLQFVVEDLGHTVLWGEEEAVCVFDIEDSAENVVDETVEGVYKSALDNHSALLPMVGAFPRRVQYN